MIGVPSKIRSKYETPQGCDGKGGIGRQRLKACAQSVSPNSTTLLAKSLRVQWSWPGGAGLHARAINHRWQFVGKAIQKELHEVSDRKRQY